MTLTSQWLTTEQLARHTLQSVRHPSLGRGAAKKATFLWTAAPHFAKCEQRRCLRFPHLPFPHFSAFDFSALTHPTARLAVRTAREHR